MTTNKNEGIPVINILIAIAIFWLFWTMYLNYSKDTQVLEETLPKTGEVESPSKQENQNPFWTGIEKEEELFLKFRWI
jgi:hypothetical protein